MSSSNPAPKRQPPPRPPPPRRPYRPTRQPSTVTANVPTTPTPPGSPPVPITDKRSFPTPEELKFLESHAEITDKLTPVPVNIELMSLPPTRMKIKNFEKFPADKTLDENAGDVLDIFIRKIFQMAGGNLETTQYWFGLNHPGMKEKGGFWIRHKTYEECDGYFMINLIAKFAQSNQNLAVDEDFTVTVHMIDADKAAEAAKKAEALKAKAATMSGKGRAVFNKVFGKNGRYVRGSTHCLLKAVAIGKTWSDFKTEKNPSRKQLLERDFKRLTRSDRTERPSYVRNQMDSARDICDLTDIEWEREEHNLDDLKKISEALPDYRIVVWAPHPMIYETPVIMYQGNLNAKRLIPLTYHDNHYDFIVPTIPDLELRFCWSCHQFAKDRNHHLKCDAFCQHCGFSDCRLEADLEVFLHCEDCKKRFHNQKCFDNHLQKKSKGAKTFCEKWVKCADCGKLYRKGTEHACGADRFCGVCCKKQPKDHNCCFTPPTPKMLEKARKRQEKWRILFYDFECVVAEEDEDSLEVKPTLKHAPNLVCFRMACNVCQGLDSCSGGCSPPGHISYKTEKNVGAAFAKFINNSKNLENAYIIAHNGGRYDHTFLIKELVKLTSVTPDILHNGNSIITAVFQFKKYRLTLRDSCLYFPMRLEDMPKAFGLELVSKGTFPYLYNMEKHYGSKIDTLPDKKYYEPVYMKTPSLKKFEEWYEKEYTSGFDFDKEILSYCEMDVNILTMAFMKYTEICILWFGWNPVVFSPTLAGYIMHVLKHNYIKEGVVGHIPENGFPGRNNSQVALKYLLWVEQRESIRLQHRLNGGEKQIDLKDGAKVFVDGYCVESNTVYEVYGCFWHGCKSCFRNRQVQPISGKEETFEDLYQRTIERQTKIEEAGYHVEAIWECQIKKEMMMNGIMHEFFKNCRHAYRLQPREAMIGGRTQPFQSLVKADESDTIVYLDFCSLYPFENIMGTEYPMGQPLQITSDFAEIVLGSPLPYRGLVFCDVLPPQDLTLPVLPYRCDDNLLFPLCRTCTTRKAKKCHHDESERYLTGTWFSEELNLAISKGYRVLRYHEVWHWPDDKWFRGGFFADFLKPMLKMKHEASGWPRPDMSDDEKAKHVTAIYENDGIEIDPHKIAKNPALRSLAKLFLNSAWGKFAQNPMKVQSILIREGEDVSLAEFFNDPEYEPASLHPWGDGYIQASRKPRKETLRAAPFTNIVFGAITTASARIKLYGALDAVGDRRIYTDTDSLIFKERRGTTLVPEMRGDGLGKLTDEVPSGLEIDAVVVCAPKVYALRMKDEDGNFSYSIKSKGFTMNNLTEQTITFDAMWEMTRKNLEEGAAEPLIASGLTLKRKTICGDIQTVHFRKMLKPTTAKGNFTQSGALVPFGFLCDE